MLAILAMLVPAALLLLCAGAIVKNQPGASLASDDFDALRCYSSSVTDTPDVEALSRRYGAMVLRRCRRLLGDEDEALDACQDVFVRLLRNRARLDLTFPSSLLYRIATNVCLNRIRDRGRAPVAEGDDLLLAIAAAQEPAAQIEARLVLDWLFGRHPESTRTMAVLHYVDGLTLEEVAHHTGLSVSGVRQRLRKLRETMSRQVVDRR
jgi:RNA polymerase sigma-70 factor, ECF subfamily